MPQPTAGQVHVDSALTTIAVAYMQDEARLIADRVFPTVPVMKQSDKIFTFDKEYWMRTAAGIRAPGTESRGGGFEMSTDTYFCDIHAFHSDLPEAILANADLPNLERQVTEFVTWNMLLEREQNWVTNFFATSKWGNDEDLSSGSNEWNNDTNGTPIEDIEGAKETIGKETGRWPNKLVLGPEAYKALRLSSVIQGQIAYAPGVAPGVKGLVTPALLAQLFDVEEVLIGFTPRVTSAESATTTTYSFVFGDNALLVYAPPNPSLLVPTGGYNFAWVGYNSGYALGISSFYMDAIKSTRIEGEMAYDQKLLCSDLGYFFHNCYES